MNKTHYAMEINHNTDVEKKIESVTLSIGADNKNDFSCITENITAFKERSMQIYEDIFLEYLEYRKMALYFMIQEKNDTAFSATEKHLGIWNKYKDFHAEDKSEDIYLNKNFRYAYAKLNRFKVENIRVLCSGFFLILDRELQPLQEIGMFREIKDLFWYFYDKGHMIFKLKDMWNEGNSIIVYSKNITEVDRFVDIAKRKDFSISNL